jgi:hypothetical protein
MRILFGENGRVGLRSCLLLCLLTVVLVGFQTLLASKRSTIYSTEATRRSNACFIADLPVDCLSEKGNLSSRSSGWCTDTTRTPRFVQSDELVQFPERNVSGKAYRSHAGYLECLSGKHIVFMGDSRVRYQYLALLDFLRNRAWMQCRDYGRHHSASPSCMFIDQSNLNGSSASWNSWYNDSSRNLRMICDCFRSAPFKPKKANENRFFRISTPFGLITITYLQTFVGIVNFHSEFPPFSPYASYKDSLSITPPRCQPGFCSHPPSLILNATAALLEVVPKLQPTHVFAQEGWKHDEGDIPQRFGCAVDAFERQNPGVKAFVISHPCIREQSSDFEVPINGCNATVFDRRKLTANVPKTWYWDRLHLLSIVNQEFNHQLLDMICGPMQCSRR